MSEKKQNQKDAILDILNLVDEVKAKIALISDSAPIMYPGTNFTQAGLNGLGFLLGSMRDNIDEARDKIKQIR